METSEPKRLQFLYEIREKLHVRPHKFAHTVGKSPQNIHTTLKRDDMDLSKAQEWAGKFGFTLSFRFAASDTQVQETKNVVKLINQIYKNKSITRLGFLQIAFNAFGIDRQELANQLGIHYSTVNRWFKVDDIKISYLYKITELYNLELVCECKTKSVPKKIK